MKRSRFTEEQVVYTLRQSGGGYPGGRHLSAIGRGRSDVLCVEKEIRPSGRERAAPAAAAGRGECAAEAIGRGSLPR